jgi:hypothetical protein
MVEDVSEPIAVPWPAALPAGALRPTVPTSPDPDPAPAVDATPVGADIVTVESPLPLTIARSSPAGPEEATAPAEPEAEPVPIAAARRSRDIRGPESRGTVCGATRSPRWRRGCDRTRAARCMAVRASNAARRDMASVPGAAAALPAPEPAPVGLESVSVPTAPLPEPFVPAADVSSSMATAPKVAPTAAPHVRLVPEAPLLR